MGAEDNVSRARSRAKSMNMAGVPRTHDIPFLHFVLLVLFSATPPASPQILPNDPRGRRLLVCTGGLRRLQEIPAEPGSAIAESVAVINCCFPKEIVRYEGWKGGVSLGSRVG